MTNWEWLESLANDAPSELQAWFDAEHIETANAALDGDTEPESSNTDAVSERYATAFKWLERLSYGERDDETNESVMPAESVDAVDNEDSRDKLEADVRKIAEAYNMDTQRHGTERFAHELFYSIIHLLDRQAAITAEETSNAWEEYRDATQHEITELQEQVDELQEKLRIGWEYECKLQAERDYYRSKFGKCLDYADAIHALMDDEGMA